MQNLKELLDKNIVKDIFSKYLKELQLSENFEVSDIKRTTVLAPETYALLFEIKDNNHVHLFRGNASAKDLRNRSHIVLNILNKLNFSNDQFLIPQNVIYDKDYNLLVYKQIEGQVFYKNLNEQPDILRQRVKLCAQWLAKLHLVRTEINLPSYQFDYEKEYLAQDFPDIAQKNEQIFKDYKSKLQSDKKNIIHGDFQPNNILFGGQKIAVFDFNDSAYDSPMIDVASFLCQLHTMLLRKYDVKIYPDLENVFFSEYKKEITIDESMKSDLKIYQSLFYLKIFASLNASTKSGVDTVKSEYLDKIYKYSQ